MKAVLDELTEFTRSYYEADHLQKKRELFGKKEGQLDPQEKLSFLEYLSKGNDLLFMIFCEEAKIKLTLKQAMMFSRNQCEATQAPLRILQTRNRDFFLKMTGLLPIDDVCQYYLYVTKLAIEFDQICTLQLGAGDCIDDDTYKDTNKDPWKRFILELKEMIEKEEQ